MSVRTCMSFTPAFVLLLAGLALTPATADAQFRRPPPRQGGQPADPMGGRATVPTTVSLAIGGQRYDVSGPAACTYQPMASLYGKLAQVWTVEMKPQGSGLQSLHVTFWRMKDDAGTTYYSVYANASGKAHNVSRPIPDARSKAEGRGSVTLSASGTAGRFAIDATSAAGATIKGNIDCQRFTPATAEGG